MKNKEYNRFIRGYIFALNECASGNSKPLENRYAQSIYNDNFDNGIFKGLFDSKKKLVK